jgi:tetratricopeptide (TPR) repeat protein
MSHNLGVTGHPMEARGFGQRAQALAEALGDVPLQVTGTLYFGLSCLVSGDYREAEGLLLKALQLVEGDLSRDRLGLAGFPAGLAHGYVAWALADRGKFENGVVHGREGVRLAEAVDHPYSLAFACWAHAYVQIIRGELSEAVRLLERGVAVSREWNLTILEEMSAGALGYTYALSGRVGEGVPLLEHALSAIETMGFGILQPLFLLHLGEAYVLVDRLEDALAVAERALTRARQTGQRLYEPWALRLLGEVTARRDPPDHAEAHYRDALTLAEELGMRPLVAHCHLGLSKLCRRTGRTQQAQEHLATATTMYREMGMTFGLKQAEAESRAPA